MMQNVKQPKKLGKIGSLESKANHQMSLLQQQLAYGMRHKRIKT